MKRKPSSHTARPKAAETPKRLKSSIEARRLIRAALRLTKGNQSAAARLLMLPSQRQLTKMLDGEIGDTPAMKLAIARAWRRFYNLKREHHLSLPVLDANKFSFAVQVLEDGLKLIKELPHEPANNHYPPLPASPRPADANSQSDVGEGFEIGSVV